MLKKRGVFFRKMVLLYTISTTIIFLFFGAGMSIYEQKKYEQQIEEINEKALFQSASACTTTLRNLYNYFYTEILESPELVRILLAEEYSQGMSINFYKLNSSLMNYSSLVESCYVINLKGQFVCSTLDTYRDLSTFPDQDIIKRVTQDSDINKLIYGFFPRQTTYELKGKEYDKQYISIVFRKYKEGFLVINLDYDAFSDMINYRNYNADSQTLLLNEQGVVMIDSNEELFGKSVKDTEYYVELENSVENSGVFDAQIDGTSKKISYRKGELFDIHYLTITEHRILNTESLLHILWCSVLAVGANLCCILLGTNVLYRPIGKLSNLLDIDKEEQIDEFKLLEETFSRLKQENRAYGKTKREKLLRSILEEQSIQNAEMQTELYLLQEEMSKPAFVCVNIYPEIKEETPYEMQLILFSIENILGELTEKHLFMQAVQYSNYLSCIFNVDVKECKGSQLESERIQIADLGEALSKLQEKMKEYFDTEINYVSGNVVNSLYDLSESAQNVRIATFFSGYKGENGLLYQEELPEQMALEQNYPETIVKKLLDAIKNCDKEKINKYIQDFFVKIAKYNYSQALKCIFMLEIDLAKYEMKSDIQLDTNEWEMIDMVQRSSKMYEIQNRCLDHCLKAADVYQKSRDNNSNMKKIVDKVKLYVEDNIASPDLTVNVIAQSVYLSASYLRNIFKEVTGGTLSNYIIEKKLEKICEMLEQTDMSLQQIADEMGFNSKTYLFTFFKNYKGMTPTQYRNRKKQETQ